MTDEQFKQQFEYITRNFDQITFSQRCLKKDLIISEINKILAEREAEIANFSLTPLEKDNFSWIYIRCFNTSNYESYSKI